jgi:hypothetical protein
MKIFQKNIELMATVDMSKLTKKYNTLITAFVKYEVLHYEFWIRSFNEVFDCLNTPVILKNNSSSSFYVNFDQSLLNILRESQLMLKLELKIPENCRKLLLTEKRLKIASQQLQVWLEAFCTI